MMNSMDCYHIPLKTTRAPEPYEFFIEGEWVGVDIHQIDRRSRKWGSL